METLQKAKHGQEFVLYEEEKTSQHIKIQEGPINNIIWYERNCYTIEAYMSLYGNSLKHIKQI